MKNKAGTGGTNTLPLQWRKSDRPVFALKPMSNLSLVER
jgi:hypothetical protein